MEEAKSVGELFAAWSEVANIQSRIDDNTSAYEPEGIADVLKEARALLKQDFEHACALLPPQFEGREDLIETGERSLMNEMMCMVRKETLLRKVDWSDVVRRSMNKVRSMFNDNMSRMWNRGRNRGGRGNVAGGLGGSGGADGGVDRTVLRNRGAFEGGRGGGGFGGGRGNFGGGRGPMCFTCGTYGHIARDCPLSLPNQQQQPAQGFHYGRAAMPGWRGQVPLLPAPGPEPIAPQQQPPPAARVKGSGKN